MYKYRLRTALRWLYLVTILLTVGVSLVLSMVVVPILKYLVTMACLAILKYLVTMACLATGASTASPSFTECELFSCHETNLP